MMPVMLAAALLAALAVTGSAAAANPIQVENTRAGAFGWRGAEVNGAEIQGYTSEISALPGETIHFHVSTDPPEPYAIAVYRLGWYRGAGARLVASLPDMNGSRYTAPEGGWLGAGWPVTDRLTVPGDWPSGYYIARFELHGGPKSGFSASAIFVVRDPPSRRSAVLVQVPVNTWEAYNGWGGKSLYADNSIGTRATHVSFDRPLPTPSIATWEWEIQLVHFLEREGYDVAYQTDVETHRDPARLLAHRLVIVDGHDEYWTSKIRDAFDAARDAGTNLAFLGANIGYWQVRYEDGERTIVGYKSRADPVTDPALQSVLFRDLTPPRYECELMGVQFQDGISRSGDPPRDYAVAPAAVGDPWFAGTGFTASTILPGLVGPEWDSIPTSLPSSCMKPGLTVLFHFGGAGGNADAVRYVAPSGARVFSAGSLRFSWGLDDWAPPSVGTSVTAIPGLQQFMRNVLADELRPAPPGLKALAAGDGVELSLTSQPDPRITSAAVSRNGAVVCALTAAVPRCVDHRLPGHRVYHYSAVDTDEWGQSVPAAVDVRVPNRPPSLVVLGPVAVRAGKRVLYTARARDADGDRLTVSWRRDGHSVGRTGNRVSLVFGVPGRHVLSAIVSDGHLGRGSARRVVVVLA
jgi:hypothetical protein